ncbi:FtsK/SpoIIIE domain-containing protein [Arthrobacter sp. MAHUQ-56]
MANKEAVDDDTMWLLLAGVGAVVLFGGGIVTWFVMATDQAVRWLIGLGVLVPAEQATVPVIGGAGLDTGRLAGAGVVLALAVVLAIWLVIRKRKRALQVSRIAAPLAIEFGSTFDPAKDLKASRFRADGPQRLRVNYPNSCPDHDPLWRFKIEEIVRHRMGSAPIKTKWNLKKGAFSVRTESFRNAMEEALARRDEAAVERMEKLFGTLLRGEVTVRVDSWEEPGQLDNEGNPIPAVTDIDGTEISIPESFSVKYPAGVLVTEMAAIRIAQILSVKLGGRWKIQNDGKTDTLTAFHKPGFKEMERHPGTALYKEDSGKNKVLYYGVDENGSPRGWRIGQSQPMAHMICVGATGGGKTTVFRSLLAGAVMQGIAVYACDPKRVELRPFQGFPGVGAIASSGKQISELISDMTKVMFERYEAVEHFPAVKDQLPPILFLVDELLILRQLVAEHAKEEKARSAEEKAEAKKAGTGKKTPTGKMPVPDANDKEVAAAAGFSGDTNTQLQMMLALARTARIHIVIGVQRPDAENFQGGARDNLTHRCALMAMSPQGALMVWGQGNAHVGTDLPRKQGRAMANVSPIDEREAFQPDGGANGGAVELQTFWLSEPGAAKGEDKQILDSIAAAAAKKFEGYQFPIDSSPYDLKPGELSSGAKRILNQLDIPLGTEEPAGNLFDEGQGTATEVVNAGSLVEGETITYEGIRYEVEGIDDAGEADEDRILLTIRDMDGNLEALDLDATDPFERILTLDDTAASL